MRELGAEVKRTRLKRMSKAKRREIAERKRLRVELLDERGLRCEAHRELQCCNPWTDLHEILKRSAGGSPTDKNNILCVCRECHQWIEANPAEAMERGLSKSSAPILHKMKMAQINRKA